MVVNMFLTGFDSRVTEHFIC
ncbi:hypothetical protein ACVPOW_13080 [Staphylococcus aureus]